MSKKTIDTLVYLATLLLIVLSPALSAQQQPETKPLRFDFTPFAGYRTSMSLLIEPHVSGTNPRLVLDASPSYGASFGVRLQEDGLVEVRWTRQDSYIHSEEVSPQVPRQRVILDQFHGDFSREYLIIIAFLNLVMSLGYSQAFPLLSQVTATVFDERGAVIPGSELVFRSDSEAIVSHTGADGSVTVSLQNGKYSVAVTKLGFVKPRFAVFRFRCRKHSVS